MSTMKNGIFLSLKQRIISLLCIFFSLHHYMIYKWVSFNPLIISEIKKHSCSFLITLFISKLSLFLIINQFTFKFWIPSWQWNKIHMCVRVYTYIYMKLGEPILLLSILPHLYCRRFFLNFFSAIGSSFFLPINFRYDADLGILHFLHQQNLESVLWKGVILFNHSVI